MACCLASKKILCKSQTERVALLLNLETRNHKTRTFLSTKGSEVSPGGPSPPPALSASADLFMITDTKRSYFSSCLSKPRKPRGWEVTQEEHRHQRTLQVAPHTFLEFYVSKGIPKYFILCNAIVKGFVFLISFSDRLLVYGNKTDFVSCNLTEFICQFKFFGGVIRVFYM